MKTYPEQIEVIILSILMYLGAFVNHFKGGGEPDLREAKEKKSLKAVRKLQEPLSLFTFILPYHVSAIYSQHLPGYKFCLA